MLVYKIQTRERKEHNTMGIMPQQQGKTSLLEKKMLFAKIAKLESLPLPSYSILELSTLLKQEEVEVESIVNCISHDHVMLALLFRDFYKLFPGEDPGTLQQTVERIPPESLKNLVSIPRMPEQFGSSEEQEWNHSYSCRLLMENILTENGIDCPDLIRTAHFHDIGRNVLRDWSPKKYKMVESHARSSNQVPVYKLESAVLSTHHGEVGAELLKAWGFPDLIWQVVAVHHDDQFEDDFPYAFEAALLQLVNWIDCRARGIECEPPSKRILQRAGIEDVDTDAYIERQKRLIAELRASNMGSIRKNAMNDMIAAEHDVITTDPEVVAEDGEQIEPGENAAPQPPAAPAEEEEKESDFDPDSYQFTTIPGAMAQREAELLRKMGLK